MRNSRLLVGLVGLGLLILLLSLVSEVSAQTRLEGKVTDRFDDGVQMKGVVIVLTKEDNDTLVYNFTTDASGYYSEEKMEPGKYTFEVSLEGYWDREGKVELSENETFKRDFQLLPKEAGKGLFWGFISKSQDGGPIDHAALTMERVSGGPTQIYRTTVEEDGYFSRLLNPGGYDLWIAAYGYEAKAHGTEQVKDQTPTRYDFYLDHETSTTNTFMESWIKDDKDNRLAGVGVSITKDGGRQADHFTISDANGWWQVGLDNGGSYQVDYQLEGYGPVQQVFTVNEGQTNPVDVQVLILRPDASIDGINTGHAGFAVKGEDIVFKGSASGGSGTYTDLEWSYTEPGGGSQETLGSGDTLTKSIPVGLQSGTYSIHLRVRDDNGQWSETVSQELEVYGRPKVEIDLQGTNNPTTADTTVMGTNVLSSDFGIASHQWQLFQDSIDSEQRLAGDQESFEIRWFDHGLEPDVYIVRLRVTDEYGLVSNWATQDLSLHDQNENRPYIEGLNKYEFYPDDWLEAHGNTQGADTDDFKWEIDGRDVSHDQNLHVNLRDLDLDQGEHEIVFAYHNSEDGWVYSESQRFYYNADEGPEPQEVIIPLLIIFIILMLIRRRRKRKRRAKKEAKKAAKAPAIPRATAAPGLNVPESSLYDGGASPYAPRARTGRQKAPVIDLARPRSQRPHLKGEGAAPVFGTSMPDIDGKGKPKAPEGKIELKSAVNYEKANIIFKVKVENNTDKPIAEVRVRPFAPTNLFKADKEERTIGLIQPKQAQTATFKLRPRGECGNVTLQAKVTYYDTGTNKYAEQDAKPRETAIICPMLKYEDIDEDEWRKNVSKMLKVEETTDKIPMDGESLYSMVCDVFQDQNLTSISMNVDRGRVFRGRAMFWAKGAVAAKGLGYAAQIEVIGGELKSKLILKAFAKGEDSLVGFYHCLLDEIEKRTSVRDYLDTGVTVQHVYGDMVKGGKVDIKDSVLQRSNITTESAPSGSGDDDDPYLDVKGDKVEGGKVEIHDSVVTRSKVGPDGEERLSAGDDTTGSLDEGIDQLRKFVKDDEKDEK